MRVCSLSFQALNHAFLFQKLNASLQLRNTKIRTLFHQEWKSTLNLEFLNVGNE